MKNFLKIFIFLEIILLAYIFNTSIYNIYEKNNIATEKLEGYVLEETSPEILDKFYTIFTEKYSQNKLELINNTLTSTDKSVYDLYCYFSFSSVNAFFFSSNFAASISPAILISIRLSNFLSRISSLYFVSSISFWKSISRSSL